MITNVLIKIHVHTDPGKILKLEKSVHIVPFGKFNRIGSAPPETILNVKYDAPEEVGGDIRK